MTMSVSVGSHASGADAAAVARFDGRAAGAALLATALAASVGGTVAAASVWAIGYWLGLPHWVTLALGMPVLAAGLPAAWRFWSIGYANERKMRAGLAVAAME